VAKVNFPINLIGELVAVRFEDTPGSKGTELYGKRVLLPDWKRSLTGTVLAAGSDVKEAVKGVRVTFGAAVGMDSVFNGQSIRILKESDLDFVYEA